MVDTYHLPRPSHRLRLQLRTVPHLQRPRTPPREEIRNLLPGQTFRLLELNQQRIIFRREL